MGMIIILNLKHLTLFGTIIVFMAIACKLPRLLAHLLFIACLSYYVSIRILLDVGQKGTATTEANFEKILSGFLSEARGFQSVVSNVNDLQTASRSAKPTMLLHLGISKTGTTALQCSLVYSMASKENVFLKNDNYRYLGTSPKECGNTERFKRPFLRNNPGVFYSGHGLHWPNLHGRYPEDSVYGTEVGHFFDHNSTQKRKPAMSSKLREMLDSLDKNQNGIIVFEGFDRCSDSHIATLAEVLEDWDVKVVINYRRFFEWLPSYYSEITRIRMRSKYQLPREGVSKEDSKELLPFDLDNRGAFSQLVQDFERSGQHPTEIVRKRYAKYFHNITVVNIHDYSNEKSYKEYLFCEIILNAPNTCAALKSGTIKMLHRKHASNPSFQFDYDMLVMEAFKRGLLDANHDDKTKSLVGRKEAFEAVKHRQEGVLHKTTKHFPLVCLSNATVHRLFDLSLRVEKGMFGQSALRDDQHYQEFARTVTKKKYCHADVAAVLEDEDWQSFFATLQHT